MLRLYMNDNDCTRLCDTIRRRKEISDRIVWCFFGTGSNGKTTVSNHLAALIEDIKVCHDISTLKYFNWAKYLIVEVNSEKDVETVKTFCERYPATFDFYTFEKCFS